MFERFRQYKLKLKPGKCALFKTAVEFLGRKVSQKGIEIGKQHLKPVKDWPVPTSTREVEQFVGFANYHRNFIPKYAKISSPLYELTGKNPFRWGKRQQKAFDTLKEKLLAAPVLSLPNKDDHFILDTDASGKAIGAELIQVQNGQEKVIAYGSFVLTPEQRNYCTTRKELLAVIRFTRQFRHYLLGKQFTVRTDHSSLTWLLNFKEPQGQLARWMEELSQYDMVIKHRPGKNHTNADALSRVPDEVKFCPNYTPDQIIQELPCKGCHYCQRAHRTWDKFLHEVDEAVSLTKRRKTRAKPVEDIATAMLKSFHDENQPELQERTVPPTPVTFSGPPAADGIPSPTVCHEAQPIDSSELFTTGIQLVMNKSEQRIIVETDTCHRVTAISPDEGIAIQGFSIDEIKEAQERDPDLQLILKWFKDKTKPTDNELFLASPATKSFWINRNMFFVDDNGILRNIPKKEGNQKRLVVPVTLRQTVLEFSHELPSAGHQGTERTMAKVKAKYHWYNMSRDIRNFVLTCDICSKNKKPLRHARCQMTNFHAGAPMERVHLDFMGPLPKTKNGNEHILMMVDQFTKWTECIPLPSQTAEVTAQAAINEFFARFGYPFEIFTDQGRNFESSLFKAVCELLKIHKARTTPYRPSANGQVERQNRSLMDAVRCFVDSSQENWDIHLPQLAGAMRSCVNRSTGYTPNRLMLGRETNQPTDLMFSMGAEKSYSGSDEYVVGLEKAIRRSHEIARTTLKSTQQKMKRDYDLRVLEKQYNEGDLVYVLDTAQIKGKSKKLSPPWKGPGLIIGKLTAYVYKIKFRTVVFVTNHDRLKPCKDRKIPVWLRDCQTKFRRGENVLEEAAGKSSSRDKKYCICRGPDTGEMMVQCNFCKDWFHITCVDLSPSEAESMDTYKCPNCTPTA